MTSGPLVAIGVGIAALLAFLWGEDEASAKPGGKPGPYISPDDIVGKQEAEKMGAIIASALESCQDQQGELDPGYCDVAALKQAASVLEDTKWTHPAVAAAALKEAGKLRAMAQDAAEHQKAGSNDAAYLQTWAPPKCQSMTHACAQTLYGQANKLETYAWTTAQTKQVAFAQAAKLRAMAKDIEDAIAAKAAAEKSYPSG